MSRVPKAIAVELPPKLRTWVAAQARAQQFADSAAYLAHLAASERARQRMLDDALLEGARSPLIGLDDAERDRIRAEHRRAAAQRGQVRRKSA